MELYSLSLGLIQAFICLHYLSKELPGPEVLAVAIVERQISLSELPRVRFTVPVKVLLSLKEKDSEQK